MTWEKLHSEWFIQYALNMMEVKVGNKCPDNHKMTNNRTNLDMKGLYSRDLVISSPYLGMVCNNSCIPVSCIMSVSPFM
jgi:hypothetical protein